MSNQFKTSKDSIYTVIDYHKTVRKKYGTELQPVSDLTIYVQFFHAFFMAGIFPEHGCVGKFSTNEQNFTFVTSKTKHDISYSMQPAKGLCPVEIWGWLENIESMHIGHVIVDVWDAK
jgi:hypothetical protein